MIATEGERALQRRARSDRRCRRSTRRWRSCCRRWSATCSATRRRSPSTRSARPLREAREVIEHGGRPTPSPATTCCALGARRHRAGTRDRFLDGLRDRHLRRPPRGVAPRCGSSALLRDCAAPRRSSAYQLRSGKVGTPSVLVDDLTARADPGHRGAHPAGRRHQAPGQDRHGRHLAAATRASRPAARAGDARRRRRPRSADATARSRSSPTSIRRSPRSPASPATASTAIRRATPRSRSSTAAASRVDVPIAGRAQPAAASAPSAASPPSARCSWPGAARDGRTVIFVPEVKGAARAPASPCCTCASTTGCRRADDARACCRATTTATTASSTG